MRRDSYPIYITEHQIKIKKKRKLLIKEHLKKIIQILRNKRNTKNKFKFIKLIEFLYNVMLKFEIGGGLRFRDLQLLN